MTMNNELTKPPGYGNRSGAVPTVRKVSVTLWLDADVLAAFKATGPDWEERINAVLREAVETGRI